MRILSACLSKAVVTVVQVITATLSRTDSTRIFVSRPKNVLVTSQHVLHSTFACAHRSEKQMRNDQKFVTLHEKT